MTQDQYPRRASGETFGGRGHGAAGRFDVPAEFVRWDSRRRRRGVYVLAQQHDPGSKRSRDPDRAVISDFGGVLTSPLLDSRRRAGLVGDLA